MPRKFFQRLMPPREQLQRHRHLQVLGDALHDGNLWHLNRQSASLAVFIGIFCAFMPIPMQMLLAAFLAIFFHANLPLSVVLVWISNPLTMPPIFYGSYKLGAFLMNRPPSSASFEISLDYLVENMAVIWQPLLLGSLVCGLFFGSMGYFCVRLLWRIAVARQWEKRRLERRQRRLPRRQRDHLS